MPAPVLPPWLPIWNGQAPDLWLDFVNGNYWADGVTGISLEADLVRDPGSAVPPYALHPQGLEVLAASACKLVASAQEVVDGCLQRTGGLVIVGGFDTSVVTGSDGMMALGVFGDPVPTVTPFPEFIQTITGSAGGPTPVQVSMQADSDAITNGAFLAYMSPGNFARGILKAAWSYRPDFSCAMAVNGGPANTLDLAALGIEPGVHDVGLVEVGAYYNPTGGSTFGDPHKYIQYVGVYGFQLAAYLPGLSSSAFPSPPGLPTGGQLVVPTPVPLPCVPCCISCSPAWDAG